MRQPVLVRYFTRDLISFDWRFWWLFITGSDCKFLINGKQLTILRNPRNEPIKVRGREIPNQRQSRANSVVNGIAALELAPQRNKLRIKKTAKTIPEIKKALISTFVFHLSPPITKKIDNKFVKTVKIVYICKDVQKHSQQRHQKTPSVPTKEIDVHFPSSTTLPRQLS